MTTHNPVTRAEFDALAQLLGQIFAEVHALEFPKGEKQPARQFVTGLTAEQLPPGTKTIETEEGLLVAKPNAKTGVPKVER